MGAVMLRSCIGAAPCDRAPVSAAGAAAQLQKSNTATDNQRVLNSA
jgi:hypothetical protein